MIKPRNGGIIKVNLGSNYSVAPGWINVDAGVISATWPRFIIRAFAKQLVPRRYGSTEGFFDFLKGDYVFVHHDLKYGIPFADESVHYLYSSHTLEHLYLEDGYRICRDAHRVLVRGGIFRICVPDLEYALSLYRGGNKDRALHYFFNAASDRDQPWSRHKYMYDFEMLARMLQDAGFAGVERCSYKKGKTPDIEMLDNNPDETLYVEARKQS